MNWLKWIKLSNSNISISIENYKNSLIDRINGILDFHEREKQRLSTFQLNIEELKNNLVNLNYSNVQLMINSLKNRENLNDAIWDFYNFQRKIDYKDPKWILARKTLQQLRDFETQNSSIISNFSENDVQSIVKQYSEETYKNAFIVKNFIENTIKNIDNWNNSSIIVEAYEIDKQNDIGAEDNFIIYVGNNYTSFTLFNIDGKYIPEDIIDASEGEEFFPTSQLSSDYFNLIREIKKPGSTTKGKEITLYTARPIKDRQWYLDNQMLPSNVFLTQSFNHAEGLAIDLGSNEKRDVWKVRINTKYLIQTLEGQEKQYQVISNELVKVKMELVSLGE